MWSIGLIDDDETVRKLLSSLLKVHGYKCKAFKSAVEFIDFIGDNPLTHIKLLIVDIMMPEMTGIEMVQILAQHGLVYNIPVLFLSALSEEDYFPEAQNAAEGALTVDYIQKPFGQKWLLSRIKNLLRLKKYHDELFLNNAQIIDMNLQLKKLTMQNITSNQSFKKMNSILNEKKSELHTKYNTIKDHLEKMVIHDLPIIKFVSSVLERNHGFIEETFKGISEEEELFKILPRTATPLKTVSSDIEQMVMFLVNIGMIDQEKLKKFDIKKTTFYQVLEEISERGGMSPELFDSFIENSRFNVKDSQIELF